MTNNEFSDGLTTLLNSHNLQAGYGEQSNKSEIVLDEYEKSMFLTQAQDIVLKSYFDGTLNPQRQGFDDSARRQVDFSSLIKVATLKPISAAESVYSSAEGLFYYKNDYCGTLSITNKKSLPVDFSVVGIIPAIDSAMERAGELIKDGKTEDDGEDKELEPAETETIKAEEFEATITRDASKITIKAVIGKDSQEYASYRNLRDLAVAILELGEEGNQIKDYLDIEVTDGPDLSGLPAIQENVTFMEVSVNASSIVTVNESDDEDESEDTPSIVPEPFDDRGIIYQMPRKVDSQNNPIANTTDVLFILNESLKQITRDSNGKIIKSKTFVIVPLNYKEYDREMSKPYAQPLKKQAWRLFQNNAAGFDVNSELIPRHNVKENVEKRVEFVYKIRYVKRPRPIILEDLPENSDLNIDGETHYSECELNPIMHIDILNKAVELIIASRSLGVASTRNRQSENQ